MWKPGDPVRVETERTVIRSMTPDDVSDRFIAWSKDSDVMAHIAGPMDFERDDVVRSLRLFNNRSAFLLDIRWKDTGLQIGWFRIKCALEHARGITTTVIGDRDYWGRGLGFEVRAAMTRFMFEDLKLHKIVSTAFGDNDRTHALNAKLGFRLEGVLRDEERGRDGTWRDVHVYGLLVDEWRAREPGRDPAGG